MHTSFGYWEGDLLIFARQSGETICYIWPLSTYPESY